MSKGSAWQWGGFRETAIVTHLNRTMSCLDFRARPCAFALKCQHVLAELEKIGMLLAAEQLVVSLTPATLVSDTR